MEDDSDEEAVYDFQAQDDDDRIFHSDHHQELEFEDPAAPSKPLDATDFYSSTSKYFAFNRAGHHLMAQSILTSRAPSFEEICAADPDIPLRVLKNSLGKQSQESAVRSRWKDIQERLVAVVAVDGEEHLYHKDNTSLRIPYREQWGEIFQRAHVEEEDGQHLGWKQTFKRIQQQWCTNTRRYGILDAFIQESVYACPGCDFSRVPERKKKEEHKFSQRMTVATRDLPRAMEEIAVKYKVLLRIDRADKVSRNSEVKDYVCHRGRSKRGRGNKVLGGGGETKDAKVRDRKSCRIGCPFRIRVVIPIQAGEGTTVVRDEALAHILLSPFHDGHRPGTKENLLSLPPHPSAIRYCEHDLYDNAGNVQALVKASASRAPFLYFQASEGEQASYRFFLLSKDVEQLAYRIKSRVESIGEDDWSALHMEAQRLQTQGKVIFYQPYAPNHPDEDKRPFLLVLQDPWMRDCAKRFSVGSSWVVSRLLRGNQFGLSLYAGIVPNQAGDELPIWMMLCSSDTDESVALKITLQEVFKWLGHVRPSAIVIEKSLAEFRAVQAAVSKDPFCWRNNILGGEQVASHVLLCWSQVRREWMESLMLEALPTQRREVYQALNQMMLATTENSFDLLIHSFKEKFKDQPTLCEHVNLKWSGHGCVWRRMWPKFGRMSEHGEIETTNFAERVWSYIKYTLLRGRSKCNILGLLAALVGSSSGRHGEVLVEHYKQKQTALDSGKLCSQVGTKPQKKLIGGDYILELYESDVSMVEVDDEVSLQFRMRSEIIPDTIHSLAMQSSSCDCYELAPVCKHVQGMRLIIEKYFPHLCALAPPLDSPDVFSLQHTSDDTPLDLHHFVAAEDSMELCGHDGSNSNSNNNNTTGGSRELSALCSEVKTELRRLLAMASGFNPTERALVLYNVRALKQKLQAFDSLDRPPPPKTFH
ncbi:hypothetical protein SELMODRAFT_411147 [Selaginella moellendorffii]|uniref:SWIM-type domain-containing protein n=1 Tax=Selaginella moellendorffii TaxID=88036 RepID=D8RGQ3_SELML|nr:uncharacterized protein LOC9632206 [Selaginella moellendorffii]EFJ28401.1 hypothetical protein SELMODRAFT_411147 [Selaginella moellendorffii]|eukprot:XP_002970271.1 uncharacterized protein LOC9632206 [Selaginella moellendorffii]